MSQPRTPRLLLLALVLACAAILGLAACGDDDSSTSTSADTSTTTETSSDDSSTSTTIDDSSIDAGVLRDEFNQQLTQVLTQQQGLTSSQAQCAIDQLEQSVSDEDLKNAIIEAAQTGQPPQDLIDAGFDAGKECAGQ